MSESSPRNFDLTDELIVSRVYMAPRVRHRYWLHGLLLLATFFTTLVVGARFEYNFQHQLPLFGGDEAFPFPLTWILHDPRNLLLGLPFSASLLGILLAHEMGHYLYCRKYRVAATLPFFLPAPTLIGTFGAFIRIKSSIRTRRALFDIGIAGPIAGFVVALPLLFLGLALSRAGDPGGASFGSPIIFRLVHRLVGPQVPLEEIVFHPIAIAAWFGMFATSLNLLPGGQLDGGHIVASVWPRAHRVISILTIAALLVMAWKFFLGWLLWAVFLTFALRHPRVPEMPRLNGTRLWTAALGMILLALTLTPQPFEQSSIPDVIQQFRHGGK